MTKLELTKEVTYVFEYMGHSYSVHHYIDNLLNLRHQSEKSDIQGASPITLDLKGTGEPYQVINAVLIGERVYSENEYESKAELLFLLPDVNRYMKLNCSRYVEFDEWYSDWSFPSTISVFQ